MNILVFGATGQVASELQRRAPPDIKVEALGRTQAELSDPEACAALVTRSDAHVVINAAAYTSVDRAETDEAIAHQVNALAPAAMAKAAAQRDLPFLHISTDYVFDGSGTAPRATTDPTAPLGAYGRSKLAGEEAVRNAGGPHAILRTSWVFSAHGTNFVRTMLRLSETRAHLSVVADQIGGPTPAAAIADALFAIARALATDPSKSGTYHFAGTPDVSWADFAREIFRQAQRPTKVENIPTSAYPTQARRPLNSRLDCTGLDTFGLTRPDWRTHLHDTLKDLGACP